MVWPLAGGAIEKGASPWILWEAVAFDIRTVPARFLGRLGDERLKSLIGRRIVSDIKFVDIENADNSFDGLLRDLLFGTTELPQGGRCDQTDQQSQDAEDNEQFQQGEPSLPLSRGRGGRAPGRRKDMTVSDVAFKHQRYP